jgi:hypothetical protein
MIHAPLFERNRFAGSGIVDPDMFSIWRYLEGIPSQEDQCQIHAHPSPVKHKQKYLIGT